jgi:hypothetical protein
LPTRIGLDGTRNSAPKLSCFKEFWLKKAEGCWGRIKPKDKEKRKEIHGKVKVVEGQKIDKQERKQGREIKKKERERTKQIRKSC